MVKRIGVLLFGCLVVGGALFAHQGHEHQLLGTVERLRDCHLVIKTREGETKTIFLSPTTRYELSRKPGTKQDLKAGARVSLEVENDGETATNVKIGGAS